LPGQRGPVPLAWCPRGRRLAVGSGEEVKVWDVAAGRKVRSLAKVQEGSNAVSWSPDGSRLAWAGSQGTIKVWDVQSGKELLVLRGHSGNAWSATWAPDGKRLASAGHDQTVKVWDAATGRLLWAAPSDVVRAVAWRPDGRQLVPVDFWNPPRGPSVPVWDAATGR